MNAMPSLNGSVGYIFTSCDLDVKNSGNVRFKDMIERFKVYDQPRRPDGRAEEWLAGKRVDLRGMLPEFLAFDTVSVTLTHRLQNTFYMAASTCQLAGWMHFIPLEYRQRYKP